MELAHAPTLQNAVTFKSRCRGPEAGECAGRAPRRAAGTQVATVRPGFRARPGPGARTGAQQGRCHPDGGGCGGAGQGRSDPRVDVTPGGGLGEPRRESAAGPEPCWETRYSGGCVVHEEAV